MPSSAQCIQIATLAAYVGRRDFFFGGAEQIAQDVLKLHRYGQTLGDLYAAEGTYHSDRRVKRIKALEDSCQELAEQLVKDLGVTVTVRFYDLTKKLTELSQQEGSSDATIRPESLAIEITDPVGPRTFYLGGRQ